MKLIDTSCWTHALRRKGDPQIKSRVAKLLESESAAWCQAVRLELWRGANNDWDRELLEHLHANVKMLAISVPVWDHAVQLSQALRSRGITVPLADMLVHACGWVHGVLIEHNDHHLELLQQLDPIV